MPKIEVLIDIHQFHFYSKLPTVPLAGGRYFEASSLCLIGLSEACINPNANGEL